MDKINYVIKRNFLVIIFKYKMETNNIIKNINQFPYIFMI